MIYKQQSLTFSCRSCGERCEYAYECEIHHLCPDCDPCRFERARTTAARLLVLEVPV